MIKIKFCKDGEAISDFKVKEYAIEQFMLSKKSTSVNFNLKISTENVIDEFRILIKEKIVKKSEVIFLFDEDQGYGDIEEIELVCDDYGKIKNWPDGFCDFCEKRYMKLV